MTKTTNIVILGGGYAGTAVAKHLSRRLKKKRLAAVRLTLIDKKPYHTALTELHEVAAARVPESAVKLPFSKIFAGRAVSVVLDEIQSIDERNKRLTGKQQTSYPYDYLVVSAGSKPAYWGVAGAQANAFPLWSVEDAVRLKEQVLGAFRQAAAETDAAKRRALLTFFVVGGGFTGVEMMGELAEWLPHLCARFDLPRSAVRLFLVDALDRLITAMPERSAQKAARRLEKMGVTLLMGRKVLSVAPDSVTLRSGAPDETETFDTATVVWTAGIGGAAVVAEAAGLPKAKGDRLETNAYLQAKGHPEIYVVGDNVFYTPPGENAPVPQMVENCEAGARLAADNLIADLLDSPKKVYRPKFHGMMVSVGGRYGTAFVGTHRKKVTLPSFPAMAAKHCINLLYFAGVLGFHQAYAYLRNEFLRVRQNRSFLGGHFATYSPTFWAVPLRLFLGYRWLEEGLPKLWRVLADPGAIFLFALPGADGVTSATQAVSGALPVPALLQGMTDFMMRVVVAPVAPAFQAAVVAAEVTVGVCLLLGLFTSFSALLSCGLCVMVYASGMASDSILWHFFTSAALIGFGGTGQAFSLDYYLLPRLKNSWRKLGFVRKWYLYND